MLSKLPNVIRYTVPRPLAKMSSLRQAKDSHSITLGGGTFLKGIGKEKSTGLKFC